FYTHYRRFRAAGRAAPSAVAATYDAVGRSLWLDGVATAAAFLAAGLTEFPGLAELGVIAGAGLLICLAAMYVLFPALLVVADRRVPQAFGLGPDGAARLVPVIARAPRGRTGTIALAAAGLITVGGFAFGEYEFNTNLLDLQAGDGEAGVWQRRLMEVDDRARFAVALYRDRSAFERARERFEALPEVRRTEAAFPAGEASRRAALAPLCARAGALEVRMGRGRTEGPAAAAGGREASSAVAVQPGHARALRRELFALRSDLRRFARRSDEAEQALRGFEDGVTRLYRSLGTLDPAEADRSVAAVEARMGRALESVRGRVVGLLCPPPLDLDRVPPPLRSRFVGRDGSLALYIYPEGDVWSGEGSARFVRALRTVDANVFGGVVSFHDNAAAMIRSFAEAAALSAGVIGLLLLLFMGSLRGAALAAIPLVVGLGALLGVMRWLRLGLEWNLASFFAVPILIGIGIAGGIHVVRAHDTGSSETLEGAMEGVVFSALTTIISFGMLGFARHQGMAMLGSIVAVGVGLNLLATLYVLPAALQRWGAGRDRGDSSAGSGPPAHRGPAAGTAAVGTVVLAAALLAPAGLQAAGPDRGVAADTAVVVMVKPGDPAATPDLARDFLDRLGAYLQEARAFGERPVRVRITNRRDEARALLDDPATVAAFVPVGLFLELEARRPGRLRALLTIPRFGSDVDHVSLLVRRDGPERVDALTGAEVAVHFDPDTLFLRRVVGVGGRQLPGVRLRPVENLADAVFDLVDGAPGAPAGILVDDELLAFFRDDDLVWPELRVLWRSSELPRDVVVTVGEDGAAASETFARALRAMPGSDAGRALLELMDSAGFAPLDRARLDEAARLYREGR
ncbi:MAG: hypothetical protein D6701_15605, partial [Gemmatimonadetes bacterium]